MKSKLVKTFYSKSNSISFITSKNILNRSFCIKLSKEEYESKWKQKLGSLQDNWKVIKEENYER